MPLEAGQSIDLSSDLRNDLHTSGATSDDTNAFAFQRKILRPFRCVVHGALEGIQAWDVWEVLFRQETKTGDEVLRVEHFVASNRNPPSLIRVVPVG